MGFLGTPLLIQCPKVVLVLFSLGGWLAHAKSPKAELEGPIRFQGAGDASAAVAVGDHYFITASDEEHQLRVYDRLRGGPPISTFELANHLAFRGRIEELDLEGAAAIGSRIFWIGSHSRDKSGQRRPNCEHLFAVDVTRVTPSPELRFFGQSYTRLLEDLFASSIGRKYRLKEASKADAHSREGLNIEGLCATAEQNLWIGFRAPTPERQALVIEIMNPSGLVSGQRAVFGRALPLDLGGLGIRDVTFDGKRHFIVAGAHDGKDKAALFTWGGREAPPTRFKLPGLKGIDPEAIAIFEREKPEGIYLFTDTGRGSSLPQKASDKFFECLRVDITRLGE